MVDWAASDVSTEFNPNLEEADHFQKKEFSFDLFSPRRQTFVSLDVELWQLLSWTDIKLGFKWFDNYLVLDIICTTL